MSTGRAAGVSVTPAGDTATVGRTRRRRSGSTGSQVQLRLLPGRGAAARDWQLDERTRRVGRHGVAQAREILRRAHPPQPVGHQKAS